MSPLRGWSALFEVSLDPLKLRRSRRLPGKRPSKSSTA